MKSQGDADEVFLHLIAARRLCVIVFEAVEDTGESLIDQRDMEVDEQAKALAGAPRRFDKTDSSKPGQASCACGMRRRRSLWQWRYGS